MEEVEAQAYAHWIEDKLRGEIITDVELRILAVPLQPDRVSYVLVVDKLEVDGVQIPSWIVDFVGADPPIGL